jgi:hypothetical protein
LVVEPSLHFSPSLLPHRNAAILFLDVFPLQLTDAGQEDTEALWQKQFTALFNLLNDTSPAVRLAAAQGTCRVLTAYVV